MVDIFEEQLLVVDVDDVGVEFFLESMFEKEVSGLEIFGRV